MSNDEHTQGHGRRGGRVSRRAVLEAAGIGAFGLASAALLGCGSGGNAGGTVAGPAQETVAGATAGGGLPMIAPKVAGKPKYGGTWRVAATTVAVQHDAHTALGSAIWHNISERLLEMDPTNGKVLPNLATSWEVADPSGLTLIFKLQPGIKMHNKPPWNGRDFTAQDVAWNMERIGGLYAERLKIPLASFQRASMVANLVKAEAVDATTVKATLSRPNGAFFNGLTENRVPMMPKEMDDLGFKEPAKFAGVGGFQVTEWAAETRQVYKKFDQYFRKGEPYFDSFERIIVPDAAATQAAFISRQTQHLSTPSREDVATVRQARPDANLYTTIDGNWKMFRPQVKAYAPFADFRVRKGIFLAIDYTDLGNGWYGDGWGYQAALNPGFPEAWKPDKVKTLPGYNPDTKAQDIAEGQKMLAAAGFPMGKGIDFKLSTSGGAGSQMLDAGTRAQQHLSKAFPDMKVTLDPVSDGALVATRLAAGQFQMFARAITNVPDAVLEFISQYHTDGSRNYGQFSSKELDTMMDKAIEELDFNKRKATLELAQQKFMDEWMPQYVMYADARKEWVQGDIGGYETTWGVWFGYNANLKGARWYYIDK